MTSVTVRNILIFNIIYFKQISTKSSIKLNTRVGNLSQNIKIRSEAYFTKSFLLTIVSTTKRVLAYKKLFKNY